MAELLGSLRVSIGLDSAELTRGLDGINKKLEAVNSEFKATMAGAGRFDNSLDALNQKANVLNRTMQVHTSKLSELKRRYEESVRVKGKDNDASVRLLTQYNKALAAMRKTEDQLDLVNKRIREQSTGFAQLGAKLNASVNTITTKMRALDAAFKATTAGIDNFGSTSDQLRQKADHLTKSIDLQQQRLKDLRRLYLEAKRAKGEDAQETQELSARMNEATAQLRETQAQLRATNTQIEQQANAWHRMGTQAQESGENLRTIGGKLQSIGSEIATSFGVATLAISGALGLATKKSMDFEQQMSNVKSVMDPAEANKYSDALTNLAVKLGADTKYSALEAAQGMEELVKAGVSTKDIMGGGLSGALSLATAGDLELADAAEIASTALNAFKDDNLSVAKAADILAGAANASATSVGEMKYGLSMTSAVAAGMGLSFKDTSTALAVFAQNGLKGSDAGTSLKTMLSRLVPMTDGAYTTMESLGLVSLDTKKAFEQLAKQGFKPASQDLGDIYKAMDAYVTKTTGLKKGTASFEKAFSKASIALGVMDNKFFDAQGNIKSMTEISGELSKALDGMSAKDKQEALYKIFGSDAIRGALILGKSGAKGFTEMANAMDKIKAADVAAERMNNLKGRIEELSGAFETAQINVGKALTPAVSALVAVLQKVVDAFNNLSPGMQTFIAISAAVVAVLLGIITTFGAVLAGFGAMAAGIGALIEAGGLLAVSGTVLGSVFAALTSPIALTIAGIMGLIAVFTLVYKHSEQLQKLLGIVFNAIKSGALVAYNGAKVAFDGIIAAVDRMSAYLLEKGPAMWNGFAAGAVNIGTAIQSGFNSAITAIGSFFYSLGQKASEFFGQGVAAKVADAAGIFFAQLKTAFSSVGGVISIVAPVITGFGLALAGVSGPIGFAITALASLSGFLFRLYQSNEQFRNSVTTVWSQVSSVISSAMTALQPVFDAFSQYFGEIAAELAPEFAETMNVMVTSLATLKPAFAELGAAIAELGPSFAQLGATFASLAGALGTAFSDAVVQITPLLGELASAFTQMLPGIISLVSGLLNVWVQVQGTLLQVITSIVTTVLPILVEGFTSLLPIVLNIVQAVFPVILSLIQAIAPVIQMIATTVLPVLLSAVQAIFPVVLAVVKAAMPFVATIIQLVASVIKDLVVNVLPLILEVVKAVFPLIVPIIQYAAQIIIQVLKAAAIIIKTVLIPAVKFILSIVQAVFPVIVSVIRAALNIVTNVIKLFSAVLRGDWKAAWNAVLGILKAIFSPIVKLVTNMGKAISDKWTYVKNKMALLTYEMKKKVMERFNSIVDGAKKLPGRIGDGIKSMAGKAVNGVKSLGNKMIGGFEGIVNGLTQKGINKVLGLVGVDKKHFIPKLEIPRYAKGTAAGGHPGGPAILGDGGGPELFRTPSGFTGLSPGRDTLFNLPKGTQVLPHGMTKKLIAQGIPAFKNGTKKKNLFERGVDAVSGAKDTVVNVAKGAVNKVKDFAFDVWDYVSDPKKLVSKVVSSLGLKLPEISGAFGSLAKGSYEKIKSSMVGFVKKQIDDFGGGFGSGEKATGNVKQWIRKAMAVTKVPSSWFNPLTTIAMKESGGRTGPSTINKWDSNWKRGTPSMGLMQTIRPTFDAYKMKGMSDIMNPVHNAVAAIRYIISRYKTVFNVPGIKSMRAGGPYKGYKIGDIVTQKQLAWVAEEGPEAVIPLKNNRQRALQLYKETGKKLGVESGTDQTVVANLLERLVSVEQRSLATLNIIAQKDPSVRVDKDALTSYVDSSQAQQATMKRLFRGDR